MQLEPCPAMDRFWLIVQQHSGKRVNHPKTSLRLAIVTAVCWSLLMLMGQDIVLMAGGNIRNISRRRGFPPCQDGWVYIYTYLPQHFAEQAGKQLHQTVNPLHLNC